jgi:guanylate kinase
MTMQENKKIIILTAPSGAGKTTIKSKLLASIPDMLSFSVSATTRKIRGNEIDGVDYIFTTEDIFKSKVENDEFIEWEMVYPGLYYGTTIDEIHRIWREEKTPLLDIDVKGAINVKKQFGEKVLTIFIEPPSIEVLQERLIKRGADTEENIQTRISKAIEEMTYIHYFDKVILNDDLKQATEETIEVVKNFINKHQP